MNLNLIGKRLCEARRDKGLTLEQVGEIVGVDKSTVMRWESSDTKKIAIPIVEKLAAIYDVNLQWILGDDVEKHMLNVIRKDMLKMPVLGSIPAGIPIEAIEDIETYLYVDSARLRGNIKEYFLLKIKGNSMEDKYHNGDVVLFHVNPSPENGTDCAVMVNGYDATFKQFFKFDNRIELRPYNRDYEIQTFTPEEAENLPVTVLGEAVSLEYRDLRGKWKKF